MLSTIDNARISDTLDAGDGESCLLDIGGPLYTFFFLVFYIYAPHTPTGVTHPFTFVMFTTTGGWQ